MGQGKKYGRLTSDVDYRSGSEYGGVDNQIAPPPHDPSTSEVDTLKQMYQTNPSGNFPVGMNLDDQPVPQTKKIR